MRELLTWLEASGLGHAMRGAGVWTYGITNLIHILGVATLFGSVLMLDLRLLGAFARRRSPPSPHRRCRSRQRALRSRRSAARA